MCHLRRWDRLGKKVALDVALGINCLHSQRPPMMHRDLKSPNVLLSEEGVAKIADVGMVRSQSKELITAQPVMTPLWAAPEVRTGIVLQRPIAPGWAGERLQMRTFSTVAKT